MTVRLSTCCIYNLLKGVTLNLVLELHFIDCNGFRFSSYLHKVKFELQHYSSVKQTLAAAQNCSKNTLNYRPMVKGKVHSITGFEGLEGE
jgi:hypothetical protein